MKRKYILSIILVIAAALTMAAGMNQGPEQIDIDTVGKGLVPFPHRGHQDTLMDCNICHILFPMEKNSIMKLKEKGVLKKKQIMKELCIQCHKDSKKAGKAAGPTGCSKCHSKKG